MEKFGQILFSIKGYPEKASNQKKQIFDKYYNELFNEHNFDISKSVEYVKRYFEIKAIYDNNKNGYESSEQKVFFIQYLDSKMTKDTNGMIDLLEATIKEYKPTGKHVPDARKLLQTKFREFLDERINNLVN